MLNDVRDKEPVFLGVGRKVSTRALIHRRLQVFLMIAVARSCRESCARRYKSRHNIQVSRGTLSGGWIHHGGANEQ